MIEYHRRVIADPERLALFERAIETTVRAGDVVADLGAGTGIFSCLACRAGASRVYAVELGEIIQIAREVATANGYADRIVCLQADARTVELPEPIDVIMGDMLGVLGIEDGILAAFGSVARRHLQPNGRMLPAVLDVWCGPYETDAHYAEVEFWRQHHAGVDLSPVLKLSANAPRSVPLDPDGALSEPQRLWRFDLRDPPRGSLEQRVSYAISRSGVCHGVAMWFEAALTPTITLSTAPTELSTVWQQALLPIETPIPVEVGDRLELAVSASEDARGIQFGWTGSVTRGAVTVGRFRAHMFLATLLPLATVDVLRSAHLPQRSPVGEAALRALEAMTGSVELDALATELHHSFPETFADVEAARTFAAAIGGRFGNRSGA